MSKKMFQHFITLVLVGCMLLQSFPVHLRAETDKIEDASTEQTQLQQTENVEPADEEFVIEEEQGEVVPVDPQVTDDPEQEEPVVTEESEQEEPVVTEESEQEEPVVTEEPELEAEVDVPDQENPEGTPDPEVTPETTEESEEIVIVEDGVSYLLVGSNRNGNKTVLSGLLNRLKTDAGYEPVDFLGLTGVFAMESSSELMTEVQSAHQRLNATSVALVNRISYNEDFENLDDAGVLHTTSGLLYEDEHVYVYGVPALEIKDGTSAIGKVEEFKTWANDESTDPYKTIVILTEVPLHATVQNLDDANNRSAYLWHEAFNMVATSGTLPRDVVVLFGGSNESIYLPVGSEMTVQKFNGTRPSLIKYTYVSSGNLGDENYSAVLVAVDNESITFSEYNAESTDSRYLGNVRRYQELGYNTFVTETDYGDVTVSAIASSMEVVDVWYEYDEFLREKMDYYHLAFDIVLEDYVEGSSITVSLPISREVKTANFKLYHQVNGEFEEITDYNLFDDEVIFNTSSAGVFAYGEAFVEVPVGAEMVSLQIRRLPYQREYLVGESLNTDGLIVEATYSDGTNAYVKELDWIGFDPSEDGYAVTYDSYQIGKQDIIVSHTWGTVTLSTQFEITIGYKEFVDSVTGVQLEFEHGGVTSATIQNVHDDEPVASIAEFLFGENPYVAYDITLTGHNKGETVTVSFPIPEGADREKLAAYHIDGPYLRKNPGHVEGNMYVFEADSFSSYLVGEETVVVDDPITKTSSSSSNSFQYTRLIEEGKQYLIINTITAGRGYALKGNTTAGVAVTVVDSGSTPTVSVSDTSLLWTPVEINGYWYFQNVATKKYLTYVLRNNNRWSVEFGDSPDKRWNYIGQTDQWNSIMVAVDGWNRVLHLDNGTWSLENGGWSKENSLYFYEGYASEGVYSIPEQSIYTGVEPGVTQTKQLVSEVLFTLNGASSSTSVEVDQRDFRYTVVKDTKGIIKEINGQQLTFSGVGGEALIKVEYTGNSEYKGITNYIFVRTIEPVYNIDITDSNNNVITDVKVVKGVENGQQDQLNIVLKDQYDEECAYIPANLTWESSNSAIATVDENGLVTFTGVTGIVNITASYTYSNGNRVAVDMMTYSVSTSTNILPSDGTNDFPEYPNEGAVRLDKTLTTIGNFSETGIARIELSLTGVPYTVGSEIDVVLMLDNSTSMTQARIDATVAATKLFIESIVRNEDGSFNSNRVYVGYFKGRNTVIDITDGQNIGGRFTSVDSDVELQTLLKNLESEYKVNTGATGTDYNAGLQASKAIVDAARVDGIGNDREQFVVFMTDGAPTTFTHITNYATATSPSSYRTSQISYGNVNGNHIEYYTTMMKHDNVKVYTVGAGISETSTEAAILKKMASTVENAYLIDNATDTEGLKQAFGSIAKEIKQAATNVKVEDKITNEFNLVLKPPNELVQYNLPKDIEFCVELLEYTLDPQTKERVGEPVVKERITVKDTDKIVMGEEGKVLSITGTYFSYDSTTHILTWNEEKITNTEFALRYYLYLDDSIGVKPEDAVESGTYPTNEYATLTYINHLGNPCENKFPIPQVTYNGAQVSYVFYLVNANGQPVNRAGKVVPFQEAVYVTDVFTETMIWKSTERQDALEATYLAADLLPDVYRLFDPMAGYAIHCFAEDTLTNNHFMIDGSDDLPLTTYVFNTKADAEKYTTLGIHSKTNPFLCKDEAVIATPTGVNEHGTVLYEYTYKGELKLYEKNGQPVFVTEVYEGEEPSHYAIAYKTGAEIVDSNFDFGNTTVAFAVLWEPKLAQDTVVIDYGLPVVVNVTQNDNLSGGLKGVLNSSPAGIEIDKGTYQKDSGFLTTVDLKYGTASIESQTSIRYTLKDMMMPEAEVFYYESDVSYYDSNDQLRVDNMYSSVTVIPATSIYYEDSFVEYQTYDAEGNKVENQWVQEGTTIQNATQQTDRPGPDLIGPLYDADNVYGYDAVYNECSTYSLGSAMKFTASLEQTGTATFEFIGTGFDIFGVTSNTTGTILVDVYTENGSLYKTYIVDTYYGYSYNESTKEWTPVFTGNALYQIPVISVDGLSYGKYKAVISVIYSPNFDHGQGAGSYEFYLDAIRIFDPAGNVDEQGKEVIQNAYIKDGEYEPVYHELRNEVINASDFVELGNTSASGIVFVDGKPAVDIPTYAISDYKNFGPNNELYLAANQAITFGLNGSSGVDTSQYDVRVQIGLKSITGTPAKYRIAGAATASEVASRVKASAEITLNSATEMYYDITDLNGQTVVIENTSGILSITNIKITLVPKATSTASAYSMQRAIAYITPFVVADAEDETPLFTVNPMMTREVVWALNGGRQTPVVQMPSDVLGPEAPEDLVEVVEPVEDLVEVDPGDLPIVAEKREETVLEQLKPEDFFEKFNVFDPQQDNIFMRILSFIASFFAEFVLWLKQLLGF